jgi:hypothetical protein
MTAALFQNRLSVINVGVSSFAHAIESHSTPVVDVDWSPPASGDAALGRSLALMINHPAIEAANKTAFERYLSAEPRVIDVLAARDAIADIGERTILHAGPPISWKDMCGPVKGAIVGAILYEGWASDAATAEALAASGDINFAPCHHYQAVGPMAGILSPSMPVWVVENADRGNRAYCSLNEGLGKVLRFGANSPDVLERLRWMKTVLAPILRKAVAALGGIDVKPLMAQALHMGDEVHNRNVASSGLLLKRLVPAMVESGLPSRDIADAARFIAGNDHFFLNVSMASCKAMMDAAHGVSGSSMVTAMSRNGVRFGIRLSGCGDQWFTADSPVIDGLYFPGYSMEDANPDLGDSTITETAGLGGFAMAAAPAIVQFVGGSPADAIANTQRMGNITLGQNNGLTLPTLNFQGTPAGIDARKVVDSGICPAINTGIAHREPGIGQIGAGITEAPLACFAAAVSALAESLDLHQSSPPAENS